MIQSSVDSNMRRNATILKNAKKGPLTNVTQVEVIIVNG